MNKVVCPYCFESFKSNEVLFRCSNITGCTKSKDDALKRFWGNDQLETPFFKGRSRLLRISMDDQHPQSFFHRFWLNHLSMAPDSADCPQCHRRSYWYICPHCHNRIPKQMVKKKGYIISIIGARSSGKTNYITTLINELGNKGACLGNIGVVAVNVASKPENNTQARYERDFFDFVYKNKKCPPQTVITDERSRIPLIYEISRKRKTPLYLVIYDTAGENFSDPRNIAANVKFLQQSDACIYLLDTFAIPYVHDQLKSKFPLPDIELLYDTIVHNIISFFEQGDDKVKKKQYKKPMALVLSKIDSILTNDELFRDTSIDGMSLEQNSSFLEGNGVNKDEIESMSVSIRGALHSWGADNFINNIENHYQRVCYFGISALGGMPDKNGNIQNLRPYRVLDPLVWILNEFEYSLPMSQNGSPKSHQSILVSILDTIKRYLPVNR